MLTQLEARQIYLNNKDKKDKILKINYEDFIKRNGNLFDYMRQQIMIMATKGESSGIIEFGKRALNTQEYSHVSTYFIKLGYKLGVPTTYTYMYMFWD